MSDQGKRPKAGGGGAKRRAGVAEEDGVDRAFDLWLQRGLHQLYDSAVNEPVPEELLRLIEDDRAARSDTPSPERE